MLRAILFDFDGTIALSEPLHYAAFAEVLARRGIVLAEPIYYERYLALTDRECVGRMVEDFERRDLRDGRRGARPREERRDGRTARSRRAALSRRRRIRRRRGRARGARDRQWRASRGDHFGSRSVRPRALLSADRQRRRRAGGEARSGGLPPGRRAAARAERSPTSTRASASPSRTLRKGIDCRPSRRDPRRGAAALVSRRSARAMPTASILRTPRSTGERSRNSSPESSAARRSSCIRIGRTSAAVSRSATRSGVSIRSIFVTSRETSVRYRSRWSRSISGNRVEMVLVNRSCVARISRPVPRGSPRGCSSGSPCRQLFRRRQRNLAEVVRLDPQGPIELRIVVLVGDRRG